MDSRLPELIARARQLAEERDRLVRELGRQWAASLRGQGLSTRDLDELWAGLTEEAARRVLRRAGRRSAQEAVWREMRDVVARVKAHVESELAAGG